MKILANTMPVRMAAPNPQLPQDCDKAMLFQLQHQCTAAARTGSGCAASPTASVLCPRSCISPAMGTSCRRWSLAEMRMQDGSVMSPSHCYPLQGVQSSLLHLALNLHPNTEHWAPSPSSPTPRICSPSLLSEPKQRRASHGCCPGRFRISPAANTS